MDKIPLVDIDDNGVFKYILIKVHEADPNAAEKFVEIVRGYRRASWHADILSEVEKDNSSFEFECVGGGRISHDEANKKIHIYGYSQQYGKADHEITAKLIKTKYSDYTISVSDEGY